MLDSLEMAKRLRAAMDNRKPALLSVDLAHRCGVTPQAVHGWRTNGRIAKRHLQAIAEFTGQPIEFFLEDNRGESRTTKAAWLRIAAAVVLSLMVLMPYSHEAGAAFSSKVAASVHYVKCVARRLFHLFLRYRHEKQPLAGL